MKLRLPTNSKMEQASIDQEIEALGGDLSNLNVDDLIGTLKAVPDEARTKLLDADTLKQLNKLAPATPKTPKTTPQPRKKSTGKKTDKTERPLTILSSASRSEDEEARMTRSVADDDELERLSQLSEQNSQEIAELKLMFKRHDEVLMRQQRDIALLLSRNTELKRELSSLTAGASSNVTESFGSRQGHFPTATNSEQPDTGREVKASTLETKMLPPNKLVNQPDDKLKIKKRVIT